MTPAALRENFHLPLTEVAKKFNMCTTAFKKACRKQGIMQWPHRTLRSLEKKIATLMAETKFTKETDAIAAQVRKLKAKQEAILSGKEVLGSDDDMFCVASPSDDSSTASAHSVKPKLHSPAALVASSVYYTPALPTPLPLPRFFTPRPPTVVASLSPTHMIFSPRPSLLGSGTLRSTCLCASSSLTPTRNPPLLAGQLLPGPL